MPKLSKDEIAAMISDGIGESMGHLSHVFEKGRPVTEQEWLAFDNALVWSEAGAIFEAVKNDVSDDGSGRKFGTKIAYPIEIDR